MNKNQEPSTIKFLTAWPLNCQSRLLTERIFQYAFQLKETENQTKFSNFGVAVLVFAKKKGQIV